MRGLLVRQNEQTQDLVFLFLIEKTLILALHLLHMAGLALMVWAYAMKGE